MSEQTQEPTQPEPIPAEAQDETAAAPVSEEPVTPAESQQEAEELDPISALEAEVAKWKDRALRSQADLDNYRKRMAREKADTIRLANADLFESLLPILDNFHLGLEAARADSEDSTIFQGMQMVLKQLEDFLAAHGVDVVPAHGEPFDPNLHAAIAHEHSDEIPEGHILNEIRRGYVLQDRLLRAPDVVVSKGPPEGSA